MYYTLNLVLLLRIKLRITLYHSVGISFTYKSIVARELGIEPRTTESKSVVLPLHHSRTNLVDRRGLEPRLLTCKASVIPPILAAQNRFLRAQLSFGRTRWIVSYGQVYTTT